MKTVYKKITVAIITLFVVSLSFLPFAKKAKAQDINDPTISNQYSITLIDIAQLLQWEEPGEGESPAYILYPLQLKIYSSKKGEYGPDRPSDTVRLWNSYTNNYTTEELPPVGFNSMLEAELLYSPMKGSNVTSYQRYQTFPLYCIAEASDVILGDINSYTIEPYKSNTSAFNNGLSVIINFTTGYKRYNFYINLYKLVSLTSSITTVIQINSVDTINSYNSGYSAGREEGYNNGYTEGEKAGLTTGYNKGYTKGYSDGRVAPEYSFKEFFLGLGDAFVTIYTSMLNHEFLGINIAGLIGTIIVIVTILFIVKIVLKR